MNRALLKTLVRISVMVCAIIICSGAEARPGSDTDAAFSYYESARKLYRAGNYEAAVEEISKAENLNALPAYTVFRAWCVYKIGDQAKGIATILTLLEDETLSRRDRREFQSVLTRMRATAQTVNVRVYTRTPLAKIWLNGVLLEKQHARKGVPSIAGTQTIELRYENSRTMQDVLVAPNTNQTIAIDLPGGDLVVRNIPEESKVQLNGTDVGPPPEQGWRLIPGSYQLTITMGHVALLSQTVTITADTEEAIIVGVPKEARLTPRSKTRKWAVLGGSVGILGLVGATLVHNSADNDLTKAGQAIDPKTGQTVQSQFHAFELHARGEQKMTTATILYGISSAVILGSLAWWVVGSPDTSEKLRTSLFISPSSASMLWTF
ncbi:MAG: hypothetical protein CMH54_11280 [Myxococcales bacterium]|nr:hypothetical protein [Myxococcales bacterium]|tara:strand:- start:1403 stop:2539 length:1137 start_codon:yes stop_codon:yes gene_type:complete